MAQEGKISRAAERLFMTQAAVSQHIHDLEAGLGVTLFERSSQGVRLTAAGETLREYAQKILWLAAAAESALTEVSNLKEGAAGEIGFTPLPPACWRLLAQKSFTQNTLPSKSHVYTDITPALLQAVLEQEVGPGIRRGGNVRKQPPSGGGTPGDGNFRGCIHPTSLGRARFGFDYRTGRRTLPGAAGRQPDA